MFVMDSQQGLAFDLVRKARDDYCNRHILAPIENSNVMWLYHEIIVTAIFNAKWSDYDLLRGVEWVHGLFLFPIVLGKM